jgi:beta-glucosidase
MTAHDVVAPLELSTLVAGNKALSRDDPELESRITALLQKMTLEQKAYEMHGADPTAVDGLWHAGGNTSLGIPVLKMVDGPRGVRVGRTPATAFPVPMARGATWNPELERRVGLAIGLETAAKGGNVLLAPTINLLRHPAWGRAQETYSEDSFHMGMMAVGFIGGVQNHVLASAKHFAGNNVETTRFEMSANMDEKTLREVYTPHFRAAVQDAHVASLMSAYNRVNGTYSAENAHLLRDILRGEWGFRGFVESDWVLGVYSTVPSALAGLDIEMPVPLHFGDRLVAAVRTGELDAAVVDEAVRRILRQKFSFGLDAPQAVQPEVVESAAHRELARDVAREALVLLKNDGGVLPLSPHALNRVAVVGALAGMANLGDHGSSRVMPSTAIGPLDGIRARIGEDRVEAVLTDTPDEAALSRIAEADVAVVIAGLTHRDEGEYIPMIPPGEQNAEGLERGGDRANLSLSSVQVALIHAVAARAKKTIVVLEGGSAILVRDWVDAVPALVMAWYPGMEGGTVIAELLFGDLNPAGKLPITFPRSEAQLPPWDTAGLEIQMGFLHGYRLLDAEAREPEFPFGFGLSYTPTAVTNLRVSSGTASSGETLVFSVDVENRGGREVSEVVQLYVSAPRSTVQRAPRVLVAFRRVPIPAGKALTVELAVPITARLSHWDTRAGAWALESTDYLFHAGTSSRDLPLRTAVSVR